MALCVPKIMILGHSFARQLLCDLERQFDDRAKRDFDLGEVNVRLFGTGGRTVAKLNQIWYVNCCKVFAGCSHPWNWDNDLTFKPPETVGSEIDELATKLLRDYSVRVVGICFFILWEDQLFNEKARLLNQYLNVVTDNPRVFTWRHKGLSV